MGDSKYDDDDDGGNRLTRRNQLLADAVEHFDRTGASERFADFRRSYIKALDEPAGAGEQMHEHRLEHTELFEQYLEMMERDLTKFIEGRGCTLVEFYNDCRDALDGKYCALFEDHEHKWFVELLVSMTDFQEFHQMMVQEARSLRK